MEYLTSMFYSKPPPIRRKEKLKFFVHDEEHLVDPNDFHPSTTLNEYLRNVAHLTGTKNMCLEGGCGVCVVVVSFPDPVTLKTTVRAVNSCLVPIYLCSGWKIYTVDKIGDEKKGYHPIQKAMVQFNGTQCGFCTSGMIMNMYALYESSTFKMKDVENSFGGNICRCTGYRPILTAFKSLASDASKDILGSYCDIEDIQVCKKDKKLCQEKCNKSCEDRESHYYTSKTENWYKVNSVNEIFDVLNSSKNSTYMIVGGNTATGVYKDTQKYDIYIDITSVKTLLEHSIDNNDLVLGANMTLTNTMVLFNNLSEENSQFSYLKKLADHIDLIAHVPVRNMGTLAGNLFTKHRHREFPSDIFLLLETVGATLTIVDTNKREYSKSLVDFLDFDMKSKIIKNIRLPSLDSSYKLETYKIMPRAQNAHALVNAGFLLKLNEQNHVTSARIVFGCINPDFVHASDTEGFLTNRMLFDNQTLQDAFKSLDAEIHPDYVLPDPTPEFRKQLAISLFYKFILSITPNELISPKNKSGGIKQKRPVSAGTQDYETNESLYPLTQPIPKIEALAQSTGKAEYIMDKPDMPGQLYGAFVLSEAPPYSTITKIDATKALKLEGVKAFYDKSDIPGENNFMPSEATPFLSKQEEIFCSGVVKYHSQPIGVVVATSQNVAEQAAELVEVNYSEPKQKPNFTIQDIVANNVTGKIIEEAKIEAKHKGTNIKHVVRGSYNIGNQYHFHMETQCCLAIPTEDGLDMYPSSQDITLCQVAAAKVLKIPANKINVSVRRLGGAYGAKISRNSLISCATALAAYKSQKPVRITMPFKTNMKVIGKRHPFYSTYEIGISEEGVIQYLDSSIYSDMGALGGNESCTAPILSILTKTYNIDSWTVKAYSTISDIQTTTYTRAPSTTEAITCLENMMQHVITETGLDPIEFRTKNFDAEHGPLLKTYLNDLMDWANVRKRKEEVDEFNRQNRWIKRGIAFMPMHYPMELFGNWNVFISIYQADGSIAISHGGIEVGQGINTKVSQVCAHSLGIPLSQISVKPTNSLVSPNGGPTGGSLTSEAVCFAALKVCDMLKTRMQPIRDKMENPSWLDVVQECYKQNIDLSAMFKYNSTSPEVHTYPIYGAACVEVEIDILTGQTQIARADIIEDVGDSMSPMIDIGQVEGAFIMGMGYWMSEHVIFNADGEVVTDRTWNYKPPGAKDIPVDFRVKFPKNNPNKLGVLNSKAIGEPPLLLSFSIALAIRDAVGAARIDADTTVNKWYPVDGPSSVENTFMNSLHDYKQYTL